MTPAAAVERLLGLAPFEHARMQPGLERIQAVLAALDHPERGLAIVHVGGTNGKGSVSALTEAILRAAGLRTGLYTSPHLLDVTERVRIAGAPVSRVVRRAGAKRSSARAVRRATLRRANLRRSCRAARADHAFRAATA